MDGIMIKTSADIKPHRSRGWLNVKPDPQLAEKRHDICEPYRLAPERAAAGIQTISVG